MRGTTIDPPGALNLSPQAAVRFTHLESRFWIDGFDLLIGRPGVRFAPSGLRTVLDERQFVARTETAGRANARTVGALRGARIDVGCLRMHRAIPDFENTHILKAQAPVKMCAYDSGKRGEVVRTATLQ
jgi:hypothetical protein